MEKRRNNEEKGGRAEKEPEPKTYVIGTHDVFHERGSQDHNPKHGNMGSHLGWKRGICGYGISKK